MEKRNSMQNFTSAGESRNNHPAQCHRRRGGPAEARAVAAVAAEPLP